MGQNVYGLPKGIAIALNEIARNVKMGCGARKKYRTEDDYYQAFNNGIRPGKPKDAKRLRLWNRAHSRWKEEKSLKVERALPTLQDMVDFLLIEGSIHTPATLLNHYVGKDIERHNMALEAIAIVNKMKEEANKNRSVRE